MLRNIGGPCWTHPTTPAAMGRGLQEEGHGNKAPYFGAFHNLKAISCNNLSAGIVRFPPFCITTNTLK